MNAVKALSRLKGFFLVTLCLGLWAGAVSARDEPKAQARPKQPDIYNQKLDAREQLATACERAKRDNSRVLVMLGGNWCGWCHKLHELFASNQEIRKLLNDEYLVLLVDLEAPNAAEILKKCKESLSREELEKGVGYPFLAVLDGDGNVLTAQRTDPLEEGDHHDPKKVKDFLERWVAEPVDAQSVLDAALARARSEEKRVFLHFGAPWCGWCHKLDDFLARAEIAEILSRDYIDLKIDVDRMTRGKEVMAGYRPKDSGGIPWIAVLDAQGKVLASSDSAQGNIGYPGQPNEIKHFIAMLKRTSRRIEPGQLDRIEQTLRAAADQIKAQQGR